MGLLDNYLVFILPATVNAFNLIILRTHYINFPVEIEEAARIDGCQDFGIFIRIVLPLSVPMLITIGLFYAVSYWNTFFRSMFFITKDQMRMLQDYLYRILKAQDAEDLGMYVSSTVSLETVRMGNIVMSILPIIIAYPMLQKYFVKGAMVGAVKG
jgi:putative aldouronate transport system permease protein